MFNSCRRRWHQLAGGANIGELFYQVLDVTGDGGDFELKKTLFCHQAHNEDSYTILLFLYKYTVCYNILHYFFKKLTRNILTRKSAGGFAEIFFLSTKPPPSRHRTVSLPCF